MPRPRRNPDKPIARYAMTKAEWAAYMRDWRAANDPRPPWPRPLDRSKPDAALKKTDLKTYNRLMARWRRAGRPND